MTTVPVQRFAPAATILLLEASAGDRVLVRQMLRARGCGAYELIEACDLATGLAQIRGKQVDLVILDADLPTDGADALAQISAAAPTAPIVLRKCQPSPDLTRQPGVFRVMTKRDVDALWRLVEAVAPPWW